MTLPGGLPDKSLRILGTRGVPAKHGGFETFAERLALYLVARGWRVEVYCQLDGSGPVTEDDWQGVHRINVPVSSTGPWGTIVFDWISTWHASKRPGLCLTLGYNTAAFCGLLRLRGVRNVINMDGIEWARAKWGPAAKAWFWLNERAGCWFADHLVADHPEIAAHLATRVSPAKITTIAYGADHLETLPEAPVRALGLEPGRYLTLVARAEPENSILEVVRGYSSKPRGRLLAVLGKYEAGNPYHEAVRAAAGPEIRFLGAIYDKPVIQALRRHCAAYIHGHQVGGTNPSLVEALGAGNAIIAHDNRFNRWVAGTEALYFQGPDGLSAAVDQLFADPVALHARRERLVRHFNAAFTWPQVLAQYEDLLARWAPRAEP